MTCKTILLVDDNPANLKLLVACLKGQNLNVAVAQSGEDALQRLNRTHQTKPDLILLDVMMPGMDGYETCRQIKSNPELKDIPVIFLSALSDTDEKVLGFSLGAVDFITKPINLAEMMARVSTHLELSELQKRLDLHIRQRTQELIDVNDALRHEIEERIRIEEQIRYNATHDSLTDLPNRALMEDRLNQLIAQAQRRNEKVALLFLDLDQFKVVNDSLGHHIGDKLLCEVAKRLVEHLRDGDSVARFGGDEFVIFLPIRDSDEDVRSIAQKVSDCLKLPFNINELVIHIGASIGISVYPDNGQNVDILMRNADTAMYYAKQSGRAEIKRYSAELNMRSKDHLNLSNLLRDAIENQELFMEYQPLVDINTRQIIGAEALMRWRLKDGSMVSPAEFIPVAESNGMIKTLGEWGLRQSCVELKRWHDAGFDHLSMAVNVSVPQIHSMGFFESVQSIVKELQLPPSLLELEITESLLMQRSCSNLGILHSLNDFGIRLSIDDFGTGYSNLAYLQDFPVDTLKIDISFIRNIGTERGDAIPSAIIAMAHNLNLNVVAEGIEHSIQEEFLSARKCYLGQGFYYSRSVSGDEFMAMCRTGLPAEAKDDDSSNC